jgi:hypothetical protein
MEIVKKCNLKTPEAGLIPPVNPPSHNLSYTDETLNVIGCKLDIYIGGKYR